MTERVCFLLQIRPDKVEDYLAAHESVWPDMLAALADAGWHNYSLFVRRADGLVVGYLETDDFAAAQQAMAGNEINLRWQATMAPFFTGLDGHRPDDGFHRLEEYFHLA